MTIKKSSELNNISDKVVFYDIWETKYVDYNLVKQKKVRANTEKTQHCLEQEVGRRPQRNENQQWDKTPAGGKVAIDLLTKDKIIIESRRKTSKNWQSVKKIWGFCLFLFFFTHNRFLLQKSLWEYPKFTLHHGSKLSEEEWEREGETERAKELWVFTICFLFQRLSEADGTFRSTFISSYKQSQPGKKKNWVSHFRK